MDDFDRVYFRQCVAVCDRIKIILTQHQTIMNLKVQESLRELLSIRYASLFQKSKRKNSGQELQQHSVNVSDLKYSLKQKIIHEQIIAWRDQDIGHMDQSHREISINRTVDSMTSTTMSPNIGLQSLILPELKKMVDKIDAYAIQRVV